MKVLIIGSGGREHALAWKLSQSNKVSRIYVLPGNGGTANEYKTVNINLSPYDIEDVINFAVTSNVALTIVGPEIPLSLGMVDEFERRGMRAFGPCKDAARIEFSKSFAKEIMDAAKVPTAKHRTFNSYIEARDYIMSNGAPVVVKADGLAAGKGVVVAATVDDALRAADEILNKNLFGEAGASIVVEEFLEGEEMSYLALTDGETIIPLAASQDHKAVLDGDKGANTGGMGAYSPAFMFNEEDEVKLADMVIRPVIEELKSRGIKFKGILYAGLMVDRSTGASLEGVKVLEYNARFGDPETQVILPRMKSDLLDILIAASDGKLSGHSIEWKDEAAVTVVMSSGGYPGEFTVGYPVSGIEDADRLENVKVFHAGTALENGIVETSGGRVLNVTATGTNLDKALESAYKAVKLIDFKDMHFRTDIGFKALKRLKR